MPQIARVERIRPCGVEDPDTGVERRRERIECALVIAGRLGREPHTAEGDAHAGDIAQNVAPVSVTAVAVPRTRHSLPDHRAYI